MYIISYSSASATGIIHHHSRGRGDYHSRDDYNDIVLFIINNNTSITNRSSRRENGNRGGSRSTQSSSPLTVYEMKCLEFMTYDVVFESIYHNNIDIIKQCTEMVDVHEYRRYLPGQAGSSETVELFVCGPVERKEITRSRA